MQLLPFLLVSLTLMAISTIGAAVPPTKDEPAKKLLVISSKAFEGALKEFVAWKGTLLPAEWVALEDILQKSQGADDPEKLKRWLYAEWREHGIGYALLAGDVDVLPVRYMVLDRKTAPAFDYAFYPSDLYYADLAKPDGSFDDWNAQKEGFHAGYIGEVRGETNKGDPINFDQVDYLPELAVGRWPASTAEEVKRIADKSTAYERKVLAESDPKLRRAAFIAVDGWVDARGMLGRLAAKLEGAWQIEKRFYGTDSPPNSKQIRGILNEGAGLIVHTGHGQPDRWEKCFSIADLDNLTNAASVPVFLSAGCSTAHFAPLPPYEPYVDRDGKHHEGTDRGEKFTEPPPPPSPLQAAALNPTCLGEQLLKRSGTGGVAYIGCNTGSQPFGLTLVDGFIRELATAKTPRLGDCWGSAIRYYVDQQKLRELKPTQSWVPPSIFFQGMKFVVFGDPSLRLPNTFSTIAAPPSSPERIPVMAWGGPPESETNAARYRELAEAGFTHNFSGFSSIASMTDALNVAQAAGIRQFVSIPELEKSPEDAARRLKEHPALAGYYLRDEPPASAFEGLGAWAKRIAAVDPEHPCYLNLFPNYATAEQLGTATYPEYVAQCIAKIPVKFISFDHYPVVGNSLRAEWYENLEQVSSAAQKAGKPFWAFALTVAHGPYPVATLEHLRLQVFSDLAYGAQGIQYFTYWTSKSDVWNFHEAPIGTDGKKTVVYDRVKQVNTEIRGLSPVFLHSKVLHLGHTGALPRGTHSYKPEAPIARIKTEGTGALVSHMSNGRHRFLTVVNRDFLKEMSLTVTLDGSAKTSEFRKDGATPEITGREWTRTLTPGDIAVLTWKAKE